MPGIKKISQRREEEKINQPGQGGLELWLRDGDVAKVSIVATGDDEDIRLDDFWAHTLQTTSDSGGTTWTSRYCDRMLNENESCLLCEKGDSKPGHKFGFWCYVHEIFHDKQTNESWEKFTSPSGTIKYKEVVNEFKVFTRGFGSRDYLWNQLVDIYNEDNALNKWVTRIGRKGSGKEDTNYIISSTRDKINLSKELLEEAKELPPIREFFQKRYSPQTIKKEEKKERASSDDADLSFLEDVPKGKDAIDSMFEDDNEDSSDLGDLF